MKSQQEVARNRRWFVEKYPVMDRWFIESPPKYFLNVPAPLQIVSNEALPDGYVKQTI